MATFNKFNVFTTDLVDGAHLWQSDTFKWLLTNTAPVATNAVYGDISTNEVANGNGYTTGGASSAMTLSNASGVEKVVAAAVTFTATGSLGPFRYAVLYNSTKTSSPNKPLVCWYDYGSSITMANTETFTLTPDATNGLYTLT